MSVAAGLSILVIDDEFDIADLIAELLASRQHRVMTAINGALGHALLASHAYDLVITDYMMPIVDGLELLHRMRGEPRFAAIPVILMSGQRELAMLGAGLAQATLQKPFSPRALYEVIERVISPRC